MFPNLPKMPIEPKKVFCSRGSRKRPLFKYVYDEKYGCPRRVHNGDLDIIDFIQQAKDDVDFASIGKMLVDTQQNIISHYRSDDGIEYDLTGQPRNIHEYNAMYQKLEKDFEALPTDIKELFNNDVSIFRNQYVNGLLKQTLDGYVASKMPKVEATAPSEGE